MNKLCSSLLGVILALNTSGCATMLKGTTDNVAVNTDPAAARVTINGQDHGTSPVVAQVPSKEDLDIEVSKEGYEPQTVKNPATFRWGYETLSFIVYVIPFVVDLSDGAA